MKSSFRPSARCPGPRCIVLSHVSGVYRSLASRGFEIEEIKVEGAAEAYVELFNRYGVDYVISSPGTEFVPIWARAERVNQIAEKLRYLR